MAWVSFLVLSFAVGLCTLTNSFSVRNCNRLDVRSFSFHRAPSSSCIVMCSPSGTIPNEVTLATILKKGVVLLAQPSEENDFLSKAAILIYDYRSTEGVTTGVILGRDTAFSLGEMYPTSGPFEPNTVYLGGEQGSDTAMMFHKYDLSGYSKYIGAGMYVGGIKEAREMVENRKAHPRDFKFIFNYVEWETGVLEREILAGRWDIANVPPNLILQQSQAREVDSIWLNARKALGLRLKD